MADRQFDIEILIKARNAASKALNDLARDVGKTEDRFEELNKKTSSVNRAMGALEGKMDALRTRTAAYSRETLTAANRMEKFNDRFKDMGRNVSQLNRDFEKLHTGTSRVLQQLDNSIEQLNKRMVANAVASRQAGDASSDLEGELKSLDIEYKRKPADVDRATKSVDKFGDSTRRTKSDANQLGGILGLLGNNSRRTGGDLNNLTTSIQRFQVAAAIKYAQSLATAVVGLSGELVAVTGSAASAGAALGVSLATGAAQAIGPVSLLAATLSRITAVGKVLNLQQQLRETALHDSKRGGGSGGQLKQAADDADRLATAQDRVTSANEQLVGAEDRVRNATDAVNDAQRELTESRVDAKRKIEDLMDAERRARLAARGSSLSLEDARRARRTASGQGGAAFAEADLNVDRAQLDLSEARREAERASKDSNQAQRRGIEGSAEVLSAKRQLQDANRQLAASERAVDAAQRAQGAAARQTAKAQRETAVAAVENTAAQDRLLELLKQLSPAERRLVDSLNDLREAYKKAFRPVTDIIVESFANAVDRVIPLFSNKKILDAFETLAVSISEIIENISKKLTSGKNQDFLATLIGDSADTVNKVGVAVDDLVDAFIALARVGKPIFDFLVDTAVGLADDIADVTRGTSSLKAFFRDSKKDLEAFFDLAGAVFRIFTAIFDPARDSGRKTIQDLAKDLDGFATSLRNNQAGVRKFFEDSRSVFNSVLSVIITLGRELAKAFEPDSVRAFAEFLNQVIIPAIGSTIRFMGKLAQAFHQVLSVEGVRDIAKFAATLTLITAGFGIIGNAVNKVKGLLLSLFLGFGTRIGTFKTALIVAGAVMTSFGEGVDAMNRALASFFAVLAVGRILRFIREIRTAIFALGSINLALAATNPFTAMLTVIALVSAAVISLTGVFNRESAKKRVAVETITEALERQQDAIRAVRDLENEGKNRALDVAAAESRLARARNAEARKAAQVESSGSQSGETITKKEARDLRDLRIERKRAEIDLDRAKTKNKEFSEDSKKTNNDAKESIKGVVKVRRDDAEAADSQVAAASRRVDKLKAELAGERLQSGSREGRRQAARKLADAERDLEEKSDKAKRAHQKLDGALHTAAKGFTELGGNANDFGLTLDNVMEYVEDVVNGGLKQFGAKEVKFAKRFLANAKKSPGGDAAAKIPGFGDFKAEGGIIDGYGLYDTVPVMAAPGEGFLTRHQMPVVDMALRASGMMGGGLNELFGTITTPHYMARGGRVIQKFASGGGIDLHGANPGLAVYAAFAQKFGLNVSSGKDDHNKFVSGTNRVSQHFGGNAIDVRSASKAGMLRAAKAIVSRFGKGIDQLIHTPLGYSIQSGKKVPPFSQADHYDHIHIGDSTPPKGGVGGAIPGLGEDLDAPDEVVIPHINIGGPNGGIKTLINSASNKVRKEANKLLKKKHDSLAFSFPSADEGTGAAGVIPGLGQALGGLNRIFKQHGSGQPGETVSFNQARELAAGAGFKGKMTTLFGHIANAESSLHPGVVNSIGATGLWQIYKHPDLVKKYGNMRNPVANAKAAFSLWKDGGLAPWVSSRGAWAKYASRGGQVLRNFARGGRVSKATSKWGQSIQEPEFPSFFKDLWDKVASLTGDGTAAAPAISINALTSPGFGAQYEPDSHSISVGRKLTRALGRVDSVDHDDALMTLVHEAAHARQTKEVQSDRIKAEGGADLWAHWASNGIMRALGMKYHTTPYIYPSESATVRSTMPMEWIRKGQFKQMSGGGIIGGMRRAAGGLGIGSWGPSRPSSKSKNNTGFMNINTLSSIFQPFLDDIAAIANAKSPLKLLLAALRDLTADDGPIANFANELETFRSTAATKLKARIFKTKRRPGGGVTVSRTLTEEEELPAQLESLQDERVEIRAQSVRISTADKAGVVVQRKALADLRKAQKGGDPKAIKKARAAYNEAVASRRKLKSEKQVNKGRLADNAEEIFAAQEAIKEAQEAAKLKAENDRIDQLNDNIAKQNFGFDVAERLNSAFGSQSNNAGLAAQRQAGVAGQIVAIQGVLAGTTDPGLRRQLEQQINDLGLQMIDLAAKIVEEQLETINRASARAQAKADLITRAANLVGAATVSGTVAAAQGREAGLRAKGAALSQEDQSIRQFLATYAFGSGDVYDRLVDRITEIPLELNEIAQQIKDNTDQLRAALFEQSQSKFNFRGGILSTGVSLLQTMGTLFGQVVNNPAIVKLLGQSKTQLGLQRGSLDSQLSSLFGQNVQGLSGLNLINRLADISKIDTSGFSPAQETLFRNLINAILENEVAVVNNTKQLEDINNANNIQTFNSSSWQLFRAAVFNGANGLVPNLANLTPMATGGMVKSGGAFWLHPGEKVISKDRVEGGDTNHWHITTPTQVLDPDYISTVMSFKRNNTRATQ